jgi:hypothetical protein
VLQGSPSIFRSLGSSRGEQLLEPASLAPALLAFRFVAQVLLTFQSKLVTTQGKAYRGRACGRQRGDGLWEGWIEFVPDDGGPVIRTQRETTQPNLADLAYWATGLTPVYLEGALKRAFTRARRPNAVPPEGPAYDEPAPASGAAEGSLGGAILDPFSIYSAQGEEPLRQQLSALSAGHLRGIVRAYDLASEPDADLEALTEVELVALIVSATRILG